MESTHTIHVWNTVFVYIGLNFLVNVGKYIIHGCYGVGVFFFVAHIHCLAGVQPPPRATSGPDLPGLELMEDQRDQLFDALATEGRLPKKKEPRRRLPLKPAEIALKRRFDRWCFMHFYLECFGWNSLKRIIPVEGVVFFQILFATSLRK